MKKLLINLLELIPFNPSRLKHYFCLRLKYMTLKKFLNILRLEYALFRKIPVLNSYPYELIIEPTNICQLKCPFCYAGKIKYKQEKGFMQLSLYKDIIDELSPNALHVFLHLHGEPLLHKEIFSFISYAHKANLGTTISTNLSMRLDNRQIEDIIDSGLDTLVVSADGITPEVYREYRIDGDFEQVVANIRLLAEKKKEKKKKTPHLEWQYLVMRHNEHQIGKATVFAKELGVNSITFGKINIPREEICQEILEKWLPKNMKYVNKRFICKPDDLLKKCWWLWRAVIIQWDGMIFPCSYHNKNECFAVFKKPFKQIWNNQNYVSSRKLFSNKISKSAVETICHACPVIKKLKNT